MKREEFGLSISYPSNQTYERAVSISINWRTSTLFTLKLTPAEFTFALASLQFRPAFEIQCNHQLLAQLLIELESEPLEIIRVRDVSTQKEKRISITGITKLGTTAFSRTVGSFNNKDKSDLRLTYPGVVLDIGEVP